MNASVATERKSFLPLRLRSTTVVGSSNSPNSSRPTTPVTTTMSLAAQNEAKSLLPVGSHVLVNGLKSGTLRYIGTVQFAQGLFCGVELDEPDGKHDGQVNDIRYFQCKPNHGIFVPHDKVILAPRERASSSQRSISRLKPPTVTRSMTVSSPINKIEQIPFSKPVQLPDIIPSPSIPQVTPLITIVNDPIIYEIIEKPKEETRTIIRPIIESQSSTFDEPSETIEADFTDSVSLILHQLQQEQKPFVIQSRGSIAISEEGTVDDDDDDDIDDDDTESVAESTTDEQISATTRRLSYSIIRPVEPKKIVQTNLSNSTTSMNKFKFNSIDIPKKTPTPVPLVKKEIERKFSVPLTKAPTIPPRKSSLIPPKKGLPSMNKLHSAHSVTSLGSQTKLNSTPSSSNSINSSNSDLTSTTNSFNQQRISKFNSRPISGPNRAISHSIDLSSGKHPNASRQSLDVVDHQLLIQKVVIQSLEATNDRLKKQYQHLLDRFDLMCILSQYYIIENEQIKKQYGLEVSKVQIANSHLETMIEQLQLSNKKELITLEEQHQNELLTIKKTHKQQFTECQEQINKLLNEKTEIEIRCTSLQERVDGFFAEMANSEHADVLLRHVETLEKDRTSLQTVLELKNQELIQIRTKIHEQVFQREDQIALQKRIDMAEQRNQDLVCLLRQWQLDEKVAAVERDGLKEQLAQIERDHHQLIFENETLLYRLRQRSSTVSITPTPKLNLNSRSTEKHRKRAYSFSSIITVTREYERLKRSLSLDSILKR